MSTRLGRFSRPAVPSVSGPQFGSAPAFSLGVEEELFLVDPATGDLSCCREEVLSALPDLPAGRIEGEVHTCQVELITGICRDVAQAVRELDAMTDAVMATGVGVLPVGTHPTAREGDSPIADQERYRTVAARLGDALATPISALHVHVGMPDADTAIRAFNGLRRHIPLLMALGGNSPYRHGRDTGFASARELTLRGWPRSGVPRRFEDFGDFEQMAARLARAADVDDYTFHWWKLRPHPNLGTVEVRALDTQLTLEHTAALVALAHALAHYEATCTTSLAGPPPEVLDDAIFRAARDGVTATLPDHDCSLRPVSLLAADTISLVRDSAREIGCDRELDGISDLVHAGGGARQQREALIGDDVASVPRTLTLAQSRAAAA